MSKEKEALLSQAATYNRKEMLREAIDAYEKALALDAKDVRILISLAKLYVKTQQMDKALKFYKSAASYLQRDGFYSRAIALYKQILDFSTDNMEVLKSLHSLFERLGLFDEAAEYEQKLKSLNVQIEQPVPAKIAGKKKRQPRQHLKRGLVFKHQPRKNRSKRHRKSLKTVKKS